MLKQPQIPTVRLRSLRRRTWYKIGGVTIIGMLLTGCFSSSSGKAHFSGKTDGVNVYVSPASAGIRCAAVMPLKAPTELIGSSISDLFISELLRMNAFSLIERGQLAGVLGEAELGLSGISDARAMQVGQLAGADGVIVGTVTEYEMNAYKGKKYPAVGIALRMIDCKSGKILWSVDYAERTEEKRVSLAEHARHVVHKSSIALYQKLGHLKQLEARDLPALTPRQFAVSKNGLREVQIRWEPSRGTGRYMIERGPSASGPFKTIASVPPSEGSYSDKGTDQSPLPDATTLYYRICPMSSSGSRGNYTDILASTTAPPPQPIELRAESALVRCVHLAWSAAPESSVTGYDLERATQDTGKFALLKHIRGRTTTTFMDGGREPGKLMDATTYRYRVWPVNQVKARSRNAAIAAATTRRPPPAVAGLQTVGDRPREVPLQWEMSPDDRVSGYVIQRAEQGGDFTNVQKIDDRETTAWLDRGKGSDKLGKLKDATRYQYRIAAYNIARATSLWSPPAAAVTKPLPTRPDSPLVSMLAPRRITLDWTAVPETDLSEYRIEYRAEGTTRFHKAARFPANGAKLKLSIKGLDDGTTYECRIAAFDQDGLQSAWSELSHGRTKPLPAPPREVAFVVNGDDSVDVTWANPSEADIACARIYQNKLFGRKQVAQVATPPCHLPSKALKEAWTLVLTHVDADALESIPSKPLKLKKAKP
jgi:fibronectin type 3 domain-containing protein/TolB-like protein